MWVSLCVLKIHVYSIVLVHSHCNYIDVSLYLIGTRSMSYNHSFVSVVLILHNALSLLTSFELVEKF